MFMNETSQGKKICEMKLQTLNFNQSLHATLSLVTLNAVFHQKNFKCSVIWSQLRVYFSLTPNVQHIILVFVLIILEGGIAVDVFLNRNWKEVRSSSAVNCSNSCHLPYFWCLISSKLKLQDFPPDPSGKFDEFKDFVKSNAEICEWVGLSVVAAQVRFFLHPMH
jgi:hypothetical protein